jgi:hypothetical protein
LQIADTEREDYERDAEEGVCDESPKVRREGGDEYRGRASETIYFLTMTSNLPKLCAVA